MNTQFSKVYACYVWNNERYDCKTARWIQKTMQCMWILNINDAWKNRLVRYLKTENFLVSISRALIEYQSSQADSNQKFYRNFDCSRDRFNRSKIWKNSIFKKQSILMQKLLKAHSFMNEMHEYEVKSFSKTLEFNLDLPKTRFSINLSSNRKH